MSIASVERIQMFLRKNRFAILILLISFVVQLFTMRAPIVMGEPYVIARNLLHGYGYSYPTFGHAEPTVTCYIPPLYVWITYAIMRIGGSLFAIQIFNLLCLQAAVIVLFRFARRFLNEKLALLSLVAICFYIPLWIFAAAIEPDALNLLLIALTIDTLYRISQKPTQRLWIDFGLLTGLQLLVRPDIMLGALFFSVWLFVALRHRLPVRDRAFGILLSGAIAFACVLPWTIRNYVVFHKFVLVSANSGFNLWMGNNASATGEFALKPLTAEGKHEVSDVSHFAATHDQLSYDQYYMYSAIAWMLANPGDLIKLDLKKVYYHWWRRDYLGDSMRVNELTPFYAVTSVILLLLGFYGLIILKNGYVRSLLITLFAYSTAISVLFFVQSRHRTLKVDPFLIPVAIAGAYVLYEKMARREKFMIGTAQQIYIDRNRQPA